MKPDEVTEQSNSDIASGFGIALICALALLAAVVVGAFTPANF